MSELCFPPIRRKLHIRKEIEDLTTTGKFVNDIVVHQNCANFSDVRTVEVDDRDDHFDRKRCLKEKDETSENDDLPIEEYYKNKMSQGKSDKVYTRRAVVLGAETFTKVLWGLIFCLIVSLCYFMAVGYPFVIVHKKLDLEGLRHELEKQVLGQHVAVADIVHNFERVDSWMQKVKIMPFVGSNGVGKTFTADLVIKHFDRRVIFRIEGSNFDVEDVQNSVLKTITDTSLNLIIIDDLHISQLDSLLRFVQRLPRFDKKTLVIPVFNIQKRPELDGIFKIDKNAFRHIRNVLDMSGFYFEVILFHTLSKSILESYVRNELVVRNIDKKNHDRIINSFVRDKNIEYHGLKGISHRLSLFINNIKAFLAYH